MFLFLLELAIRDLYLQMDFDYELYSWSLSSGKTGLSVVYFAQSKGALHALVEIIILAFKQLFHSFSVAN